MASPPFLPDETKPGASDLVSAYPAAEQAFRDIIESWLLIEHNTSGTHKLVTLDDIATPTIAANLVGLWHESGVLKTRFAAGGVENILKGTIATGDIADDAVTYAKIQDVSATSRFLGRITGGAGDTEELTGTQATTLLNAFTSSLKGLVPSSAGGTVNFLRADGAFAVPPGDNWVVGTVSDTSSGTTHTYGSLPASIQSMICMFSLVSLADSSNPLIQFGTSGGLKTTGYTSQSGGAAEGTGFIVADSNAGGDAWTGELYFNRITGNKWTCHGTISRGSGTAQAVSGRVDLAGELTQIQLMNGTFDNGEFNMKYLVG